MTRRWTARAMAAAVRAGELSAASLTEDALAGIAALDPVLHFANSLAADSARAAAARVDALPAAERERQPLAGVPFLAKARMTLASPVNGRLADAGAVLLGTTTRPGLGAVNQTWGWNGSQPTSTPWHTGRTSGGSSAGAAAPVAAGVVPVATGGDAAGSLRVPASFCGVTTLKGSYGRVPRVGGRSVAELAVVGVIGADLDDVVLATSLADGPAPCDPTAHRGLLCRPRLRPPEPAAAGLIRLRPMTVELAGPVRLAAVTLPDPPAYWPALASSVGLGQDD